jgi:hypothetical protein
MGILGAWESLDGCLVCLYGGWLARESFVCVCEGSGLHVWSSLVRHYVFFDHSPRSPRFHRAATALPVWVWARSSLGRARHGPPVLGWHGNG